MGRYDFRPIRVLQHANQLLETGRISHRPPWHSIVAQIPPGETIVRPVKRFDTQTTKGKSRNRRSSRMFQPLQIVYPEDKLRTQFFNDHPWELARPKTVVENDGNDGKNWNWERIQQPGKPLDGDSVVRRQLWLIKNYARSVANCKRALENQVDGKTLEDQSYRQALDELDQVAQSADAESITQRQSEIIKEYSKFIIECQRLVANEVDAKTVEELAYDQARKEFYQIRLEQDVERQVAREEALHYGSYFETSANEKSLKFEDDAFEDWKTWALQDIEAFKHKNASMFSGGGAGIDPEDEETAPVLEAASEAKVLA